MAASASYFVASLQCHAITRAMEEELVDISIRYSRLVNVAVEMNKSLEQVVGILQKYCCLPRVFPEVLNRDELSFLKWYVLLNVGVDPNDEWDSIERVFNWVARNIKYVGDPKLPLPDKLAVCDRVGDELYCYYEFREAGDYVQPPTETIRRGGGDCEDHAILVYAMLYYYLRHIRNADYTIWMALMTFGDGSRHAAVFIPAQNSTLLIVDTSGDYITKVGGKVASRPVVEELDNYSLHFLKNGGIYRINLYSIDIERQAYTLVISGGVATAASYIENYIVRNPRSVLPLRDWGLNR